MRPLCKKKLGTPDLDVNNAPGESPRTHSSPPLGDITLLKMTARGTEKTIKLHHWTSQSGQSLKIELYNLYTAV